MFDENGNNMWPDFLQFLFLYASAPNFQLQESALRTRRSIRRCAFSILLHNKEDAA